LRTVVLLLVLANLVALAWWQGWLDHWYAPQREPARVAAQVAPQKLRVVPLEQLRRATESASARCREVGPLEPAAGARVASWLAGVAGQAEGEQEGSGYRVRFGPALEAELLAQRMAELTAAAGREPVPCQASEPAQSPRR
jgi:hypothetical protein